MRENVENLRKMYTHGKKVKLIHMDDPYPLPEGITGTVNNVDDAGVIHVYWKNGSTLGLLPDIDLFEVIE